MHLDHKIEQQLKQSISQHITEAQTLNEAWKAILNTIWQTNPSSLKQGLLEETTRPIDIATSNNAFFIVQDPTSPERILVTQKGAFALDREGTLSTPEGFKLLAIQSETLVSSSQLAPVNLLSAIFNQHFTPTKQVDLNINLDASERIVTEDGQILTFNHHTADDIILPSPLLQGAINNGLETIILTTSESSHSFTYGGFTISTSIQEKILGAHAQEAPFTKAVEGSQFTITTGNETHYFTYKANNPNISNGEFNNLNNLVTAIDSTEQLSAKITSTGSLVIAPEDATQAMSFKDIGKGAFVSELHLKDTNAAPNRFVTLQGLGQLIQETEDFRCLLIDPLENSQLSIASSDPMQGFEITLTTHHPGKSILSEAGLAPDTTKIIAPYYTAGALTNEQVIPSFTYSMSLIDQEGVSQPITFSFLKVGMNQWAVEIYRQGDNPVMMKQGFIHFNGDGSLNEISSSLTESITLETNSNATSTFQVNWGTSNHSDGLVQFYADYNVSLAHQDGTISGAFSHVAFDEQGHVIAYYINGDQIALYTTPLAQIIDKTMLHSYQGYSHIFETTNVNMALTMAENQLEVGMLELPPYQIPKLKEIPFTLKDKSELERSIFNAIENNQQQENDDFFSALILDIQKSFDALTTIAPGGKGALRSTHEPTNIAIVGKGLFLVQDEHAPEKILLTKEGDFSVNEKGEWVNSHGFKLLGVGSDQDSSVHLDNLQPINYYQAAKYVTSPTKHIEVGINLNASEPILQQPYDPSGVTAPNIASGMVIPVFSRHVSVFDSLGDEHDFQMSFVKTALNQWAIEIYALNDSEIVTNRTDGQIISGTILFNGDGTLQSLSPTLTTPIHIVWANQATTSFVTFDFGTAGPSISAIDAKNTGKADGLSQFDASYDVRFVEQDGHAPGLITSIKTDEYGSLYSHYSNGLETSFFEIPLATPISPESLKYYGHHTWEYHQELAGTLIIDQSGKSGLGKIMVGYVEEVTV